jgi:hypothetical protein
LGWLSKSSGCIYLTYSITLGMRCNTPYQVFSQNFLMQFLPKPQKRKRRATWVALQIIRVHLIITLYHFGAEV